MAGWSIADEVTFDHAAARRAADALRLLATSLEEHAAGRDHRLRALSGFRGGARTDAEDCTRRLARRTGQLARRLRAEADGIDDAALAARVAARHRASPPGGALA